MDTQACTWPDDEPALASFGRTVFGGVPVVLAGWPDEEPALAKFNGPVFGGGGVTVVLVGWAAAVAALGGGVVAAAVADADVAAVNGGTADGRKLPLRSSASPVK